MSIELPLQVRVIGEEGDEWPDRRVSLASGPYAIMISPAMANLDVAQKEAQFLADAVNEYTEALSLIDEMKGLLDDPEMLQRHPGAANLIEKAYGFLENNALDKLHN